MVMKEFKRSSVTSIAPITRTEEEKSAYERAMVRFEKEMKKIRADAIYKASQSQLSASKVILR